MVNNINIKDGWLIETPTIKQVLSPNYDSRPAGDDISLLVIHHISLPPNQFGGGDIEAFFCNQLATNKHPFYQEIKKLTVSAHALIKRNGHLIQFVNFNHRAWHAGQSEYRGRVDCNNFSIGIELEGDDKTPYRYAQYQVLAQLTHQLIKHYPALAQHIVGHQDIAPNRKTDPGPTFNWKHYLKLLAEIS